MIRRRRAAVSALIAVGAVGAAMLAGCSSSEPARVCVPEMSVTPSDPRPGRIVTVDTVRACPVDLPEGEKLEIRIHPADDRIPIARAFVRPDADGAFTVSITVPPTIRPGATVVEIANWWDYAACPDTASCAAAEGAFEVSP